MVIESEIFVRTAIFIITMLVFAVLEMLYPRRKLTKSKLNRWLSNISMIVIGRLLIKLLLPFAAIGTALYVEQQQFGMFYWLEVPFIFSVVLSVILLDLMIYLQHRVFHYVPVLWCFHKVHHSDQDLDVSSGVRFHPVEIVFSMLIKMALVALCGLPALGVLIFEVLLSSTTLFNHSNLKIPEKLDAVIRMVVVTPDMHRIHHSAWKKETNSNFGFNLSIWDRLCKTYVPLPKNGQIKFVLGLNEYNKKQLTLSKLLVMPFTKGSKL